MDKDKIKEILVGLIFSLCIGCFFLYFYGNTKFINSNVDKTWYYLIGFSLLFVLPVLLLINYKLEEKKYG